MSVQGDEKYILPHILKKESRPRLWNVAVQSNKYKRNETWSKSSLELSVIWLDGNRISWNSTEYPMEFYGIPCDLKWRHPNSIELWSRQVKYERVPWNSTEICDCWYLILRQQNSLEIMEYSMSSHKTMMSFKMAISRFHGILYNLATQNFNGSPVEADVNQNDNLKFLWNSVEICDILFDVPFTKASDAELWYFLWFVPEQTVK